MAKGNPFMGTARGKLADMVLYRRGGEQISRVRIRRIANPRTEAQLTNRVVVSTLSKRYAFLKPICDHAFQGFSTPAKNMAEFMKQNTAMIQADIATARESYLNWGYYLSNFNGRNDFDPLAGYTIVSKGTLPEVKVGETGTEAHLGIKFTGTANLGENPTYAQIAAAMGVNLGDQITLVYVTGNYDSAKMEGLSVARFILQPASGNGNTPFLSNGAINDPNLKNEMDGVSIAYSTAGGLSVLFENFEPTQSVAYTAIASRFSAGQWERSLSYLHLYTDDNSHKMGLAIDSWNESVDSSKYLNKGSF